MKRKTIKLNLIFVLLAVFISSTAIVTYAFFSNKVEKTVGTLTPPTVSADGTKCEISSEYALRYWANDIKYNCNLQTSQTSSRYVLKLTNDITLSQNITITRDVYLDLNGKTINLQNFNLIFENTYNATLNIFSSATTNATINSTTGKINYFTPNCLVLIGENIIGKENIVVVESNSQLLKEEIVKNLSSRIFKYYDTDIELTTHFMGYSNIKILWTSSDTNLVSNLGKVNLEELNKRQTSVLINLTYTVILNETQFVTGTIAVTLVPKNDFITRLNVGKEFLENYFSVYKDNNLYILSNNISLPKSMQYFGITFTYATSDVADIDTVNYVLLKPAVNKSIHLTAKVAVATHSLDISFDFLATFGDNNGKVQEIINKIGVLIIKDKDTKKTLVYEQDKINYSIDSVEYTFENNKNNYDISGIITPDISADDILYVKNLPNYEDEIYLNIAIKFKGSTTPINTRLRIYYIDSSGGGGSGGEIGSDPFALYYYLVTQELTKKTYGGKTYLEFLMPKYFLNSVAVHYELDKTYSEIVIEEIVGSDDVSFKINFAQLTKNNISVNVKFKFANKNTDASYDYKWATVPYYGTKYENSALVGTPRVFNFFINGIIKYHATDTAASVNDVNFYNELLKNYSLSDLDANKVLTTDEINETKDILEINNKAEINSYKGLELLQNVNNLKIIKSNFKDSDFEYLKLLKNLKSLVLTGNKITTQNLYKISEFSALTLLNLSENNFGTGISFELSGLVNLNELILQNCALTKIDGILKVFNISTLKINNVIQTPQVPNLENKIESIRPLIDMEKLINIYYYNNKCENTNFGSNGIYNSSTLVMLERRNKKVYINDSNTYFTPTPSQLEGSGVIESVVIYGKFYLSNGKNTIELPSKVYKNATNSYEITWDILGVEETKVEANDICTITANTSLQPGIYKISGSVKITVNSVVTEVVRIFEVEVA